jgi:hypothetical protein
MVLPVSNFHKNVDEVLYQFFLNVTLLHWIFVTRFKCLHILGQNCFCEFRYSGPNWFSKKFLIFQFQSQPPDGSLRKPDIKYCKISRQFELDIGPAMVKVHVVFKMRAKCCIETSETKYPVRLRHIPEELIPDTECIQHFSPKPWRKGSLGRSSVHWRIILKFI